MKKIIIFLALILITIALLPLFGNRVVEQELAIRLEVLKSYGVEIKEESDSSYFSSKKHYELKVIDRDKFLIYLQQFSTSQFPSYLNSMIEGVTVGSDVRYSNFLINDGVSVDIYPLSLPSSFVSSVKAEDAKFLKYLETVLQSKAILYHIDYNIVKSKFKGYIKDIQESYILQDGSSLNLTLKGSTFSGNGLLLAPERIDSCIKHMSISVTRPKESVLVTVDDFTTTSNFATATTYAYSSKMKSFKFEAEGTVMGSVSMEFDKLYLSLSSNTQGQKAELYSKSSFDSFKVAQEGKKFRVSNFNYDLALRDIDKDSFEKLRVLLLKSKVNSSAQTQEMMQASFLKLLSNGLKILVADFSIKQMDFKNEKNIDGFSLQVDLKLKKDLGLIQNPAINPNQVTKNLTLNSKLKISKQLFATIAREAPLVTLAKGYAKEEAQSLIYEFTLIDGLFSLNGKTVR